MYELRLDDGRVLLTRVSHPVDRTTYGRSMWSHILRDQLEVTEGEFGACARDHVLPERSRPVEESPALPVWLAQHLLDAGIPKDELVGMDEPQARKRLGEIWSTEGDRPRVSPRG
ncbi:cytotoxic translational repressor of toxin-antitoxin stability system [Actinotalea sp. C106]|uniref:cytotoxic translational repressor of toxin-antitoxin stability system n=1 Tax=Actinotalea sp. C106 TaxID=2908644 RepID=UPI002029241E|nr:cytotoxic translational repressor of toxin-antitoxin stability system [Actinotalea sp. C106]